MGRQRPEGKAGHIDRQVAFHAVGRQKEKQSVPVGVDQLAHMLQYHVQVGYVGERNVMCRAWMIDERDRPPVRPKPIVKDLAYRQYLALEDSLAAIARETNEIELGATGWC